MLRAWHCDADNKGAKRSLSHNLTTSGRPNPWQAVEFPHYVTMCASQIVAARKPIMAGSLEPFSFLYVKKGILTVDAAYQGAAVHEATDKCLASQPVQAGTDLQVTWIVLWSIDQDPCSRYYAQERDPPWWIWIYPDADSNHKSALNLDISSLPSLHK